MFITFPKSLCKQLKPRVRAYGDLPPQFLTVSGSRRDCFFSFFLFKFVIEMVVEAILPSCDNSGFNIHSDGKLSDVKYMNDVLLSKDSGTLWIFSVFYATV